jgi:hypothetical protein
MAAAAVDDDDAARMEVRFKGVGADGREALKAFFRDPASVQGETLDSGRVPPDLVPFLQALPIFLVYSEPHAAPLYHTLRTPSSSSSTSSVSSEDHGDGEAAASPGAVTGAPTTTTKHLPPEEDLSEALLDETFVQWKDARDRGFLEQLGVRRMSAGRLFLDHVLPRLDPETFVEEAIRKAKQRAREQQGDASNQDFEVLCSSLVLLTVNI